SRSFARGGFSNVWGAAIQTFSSEEFQYWPITSSQLSRHYSAVRDLMCSSSEPMARPSAQARAFYADLVRYRLELELRGIRFDYATLAVRSADDDSERAAAAAASVCMDVLTIRSSPREQHCRDWFAKGSCRTFPRWLSIESVPRMAAFASKGGRCTDTSLASLKGAPCSSPPDCWKPRGLS